MKGRKGSQPSPSSLRLGLTLVIVLVVISSPFLIINPVLISAKSSNVDTSSQHSAFSLEDSSSSSTPLMSSSSPPTNVSPMDSDFTTQAPLQIPRTLQSTDLVNSLAFYEVTFITSTTGVIDLIQMVFPAGTNIGAAGVIERVGIGGGALTKAGSTLTFDVTTPVSIPAGTFIRLEMFGIKNPSIPSTFYGATLITRDSGGTIIDGPSPTNVYTIKQIGGSDVAESFMKRVTVLDNAAGHAVGWDPNGGSTIFTISESNILADESVFFTVEVANTICAADSHSSFSDIFVIRCQSPPSNNAALRYVVGNLPEHIVQ